MSNALVTMANTLAQRLDMGADGSSLIDTLKATAFKGQVSDAQMVALLVVANQYGLNPWTKEVYAFPDQNNGIIPVVGVDGWSRIINSNDQFDGMDFEQDDQSCTCIIYRKDRSRPIKITEYMSECRRDVKPWKSHPKRMLRHKAMIQCARIAFGYVGIYDQDEAERIQEVSGEPTRIKPDPRRDILPEYLDADFQKNLPTYTKAIEAGRKTADDVISTLSTKYTVSREQQDALRAIKPKPADTKTQEQAAPAAAEGAQQA